jgi:hypothetical protein
MPQVFRGATPTPRSKLVSAPRHRVTTPTPPQWLWKPAQLSEWGNFGYGDCVTAEEAFAKACHDPEIFIPEHKIIQWARRNYVLNGAGLYEVLELMVTKGIGHDNRTYLDGPFTAVDWSNAAILQNAIAQGPVKFGVASDHLEIDVWQKHPYNGWLATGLPTGDPQDHCVSICGYGKRSWLASELGAGATTDETVMYALFTWSSIGIIDWQSLQNITGEAWLRSPTTVVK